MSNKKKIILHGFTAAEVAQFIYAAFTVLLILFTWSNVGDAALLLLTRAMALGGTLLLWLVYQLWPVKAVMLCRVAYMLFLLGVWYPDTYELNHQFGSYDHLFASADQSLFGFQPAAVFSQTFSSPIVSELMYMGYVSYYLFFILTIGWVFFKDYKQLDRVMLIVFGGFFLCYVVYDLLPVTGPQYYYLAVGMDNIMQGNFPDINHFFSHSTECLKSPGWQDGLFYQFCQMAHQAGERPTAAFPSSHVAIATLVMMICLKMRLRILALFLLVPYVFLCFSTVYIYAHYAVDSIAGFFVGIALFYIFGGRKLASSAK